MSKARPPLLLASASPYRRQLLQAAGLCFEVCPAEVDEAAIKGRLRRTGTDAGAVAAVLARTKAEAVSVGRADAIIIGADQVLSCDGELFDKPGDLAGARRQLERLRGRRHQLHSAVALAANSQLLWQHTAVASLLMRPFSDAFLDHYLTAVGPAITTSVGGYQIEGLGIQLFDEVDGDGATIIGLPLLPLLRELRLRGLIAA
ncbi:MAG TPA: Maf family protein [Hyphomicrobiaceae bacterium]|nr:Maf family protein [Hyphomicrobiaceae bacterium]